jgi:flagellar biosynthesis/type III secretory pathway chaperone
MDAATVERSYSKLITNLEDLTKLYRSLLDVVRKEKEIYLNAKLEELHEINQSKEALLMKIKMVDTLRLKHAQELASLVGADAEAPRLLEIAKYVTPVQADRLRTLHAALDVLLKRLTEINKENEEYAQKALKTLNGAMNDIKETLAPKKTYGKKGQMTAGPETAGNFVRKET